jgi:AcrR family transcriptional regulator
VSVRGGDVELIARRAPFSENPRVGARGQRTRQQILDAALEVFGREGYAKCSIAGITRLAGCSRVSFYQYFSGKQDVFRHLAGQVARQVSASTEALDPLTPDSRGWTGLRAWVGRYAEIHQRYRAVFQAFPAAEEDDESLEAEAARLGEESVARIRARVSTTSVAARQLDPVIALLLACLTRSLDDAVILRTAVPVTYSRETVETAVTDVFHRTLFGCDPANQRSPGVRPPRLPPGPAVRNLLQQGNSTLELSLERSNALRCLMESGRDVFVTRGYHGTRVDDLVSAAGVSRGVFYRYFQDKDHLAAALTVRAMRTVSSALVEIPDPANTDGPALRRWLRRYNSAQAGEAAMIRVWVDAALEDHRLRVDSASALDWGRRQMARFLSTRGFGDVEMEAVVMVALLGAFGVQPRSPASVEAAAQIIERGLLGR